MKCSTLDKYGNL